MFDPCVITDSDTALTCLHNLRSQRCDDRNDWIRVAASLKAASDGEVMFSHFVKWSKQSSKFTSADECRTLWDDMNRGSLATLIRMAEEDGFYLPGQRAVITVDADEKRVVDEIVVALPRDRNLYVRGNQAVHVSKSTPPPPKIARDAEAPRIQAVSTAAMREVVATVAKLNRFDRRQNRLVPCHVPQWAVNAILSRDSLPVPSIEMVTEVPILREDGSVAAKPGFDRDSGVYYAPTCHFPIVDDVEAARNALIDLVGDCPWPNEAHKSAWLANILTPLARLAFKGPAPLNLADANTPGAGKTLTQSIAAIIGTGRALAVTSCPESDAEWRKRITAIALTGEPTLLIDNIAGDLSSPSLDAALTSTTWSDRLLGVNKTISVPLRVTFYANGNNVTPHRDTLRRINYYRLESQVERPEERGEFKYPNLLAHVQKQRGHYTACALAILSAYCRAGRPCQGLSPLGSYEAWSDLVRSSIKWAGMPDPMETRTMLAESSDTDGDCLRQLLAGWQEGDSSSVGMTVAEAFDAVDRNPDKFTTLQAVLGEFGRNRQALGIRLNKYRSRICGGLCFAKINRGRTTVWKVVSA